MTSRIVRVAWVARVACLRFGAKVLVPPGVLCSARVGCCCDGCCTWCADCTVRWVPWRCASWVLWVQFPPRWAFPGANLEVPMIAGWNYGPPKRAKTRWMRTSLDLSVCVHHRAPSLWVDWQVIRFCFIWRFNMPSWHICLLAWAGCARHHLLCRWLHRICSLQAGESFQSYFSFAKQSLWKTLAVCSFCSRPNQKANSNFSSCLYSKKAVFAAAVSCQEDVAVEICNPFGVDKSAQSSELIFWHQNL